MTLAACGGEGEEKAASASSSEEGPALQSGKAGSFDDIPIYPGAKAASAAVEATEGKEQMKGEHRAYETDDPVDEVADFYKKQMPENGWKKIIFQKYPEGSYMGTWMKGGKGTGAFINIFERRGDGKTHIAIVRVRGGVGGRLWADAVFWPRLVGPDALLDCTRPTTCGLCYLRAKTCSTAATMSSTPRPYLSSNSRYSPDSAKQSWMPTRAMGTGAVSTTTSATALPSPP